MVASPFTCYTPEFWRNQGISHHAVMQLEWSRHSEQVVSAIRGLQESDQSLKDVTLSAGGRQLRAHRLMLAAASDYFKVQDSAKRRAPRLREC